MPRLPAGGGMAERWHSWAGTFTGVVLITVTVLPLVALAAWALAHRRRTAGTSPARAWKISSAEVAIVYGTLPWVWMILLPGERSGDVRGRVSPAPLQDLLVILTGDRRGATVQVVGNLLVFAALGFFAPLRFAALASVPRIVAFAAGCSVLVETLQYVLWLDRVSSVDDVLLNAAGAGLSAVASRHWWRPTPSTALPERLSQSGAAHPGIPARHRPPQAAPARVAVRAQSAEREIPRRGDGAANEAEGADEAEPVGIDTGVLHGFPDDGADGEVDSTGAPRSPGAPAPGTLSANMVRAPPLMRLEFVESGLDLPSLRVRHGEINRGCSVGIGERGVQPVGDLVLASVIELVVDHLDHTAAPAHELGEFRVGRRES
jgi:hypothetical protein